MQDCSALQPVECLTLGVAVHAAVYKKGTSQGCGRHRLLSCTPRSCHPGELPVQQRRSVSPSSPPSFSPHPPSEYSLGSLPRAFPRSPPQAPFHSSLLTGHQLKDQVVAKSGGGGKTLQSRRTSVTPVSPQSQGCDLSVTSRPRRGPAAQSPRPLLPFSPPPWTCCGPCSVWGGGSEGRTKKHLLPHPCLLMTRPSLAPLCPLLGISLLLLPPLSPSREGTNKLLPTLNCLLSPVSLPGAKKPPPAMC